MTVIRHKTAKMARTECLFHDLELYANWHVPIMNTRNCNSGVVFNVRV